MFPKYQNFMPKIPSETKHATYTGVARDARWVDAMKTEIKSLDINKTWNLIDLPKGKKAISCR